MHTPQQDPILLFLHMFLSEVGAPNRSAPLPMGNPGSASDNSLLLVKMAGNDEMFDFKCKLIEEIKMYPAICDKAHPDHFWCNKKDAIFEAIGAALGVTGKFYFSHSIKHVVLRGKSITVHNNCKK